MTVIFSIKDRRVIPNWRDFRRTMQIGELHSMNNSVIPLKPNIERAIQDWKENGDIGTAADLLNSAFVANIHYGEELDEAIKLIDDNENQATKSLLDLVKLVKSKDENKLPKNEILEMDADTIDQVSALINNKALHRIINRTKNKAKNELYNPVVWVDLARLYALHGHNNQANKSILTALQLAPENRFVLRSATRFFIHTDQFDKALFYLRNSNNLRRDPWLISAHIATSCLMNRFSPLIKEGAKMVDSKSFSDFEITELASSLGSFEYREGSFKKAKQFFQTSMRKPNDNSLAQMEWISKKEPRLLLDPLSFEKVINPFEALSYDYFNKGNYIEAFNNCIKWFLDVPFSKRPVLLGSHISGSLLKDKETAILLLSLGLQANSLDPTLLNNMVYYLVTSGKIDASNIYLKRLKEINLNDLSNENKITIQATFGLVCLRRNDTDLGKRYYEIAISNADRINDIYLKNSAIANFTRELILKNDPEKERLMNIVIKMKIDATSKDLILLRNEVIDLYKKNQLRF